MNQNERSRSRGAGSDTAATPTTERKPIGEHPETADYCCECLCSTSALIKLEEDRTMFESINRRRELRRLLDAHRRDEAWAEKAIALLLEIEAEAAYA